MNPQQRVRSIISNLNYSDLRKQKVLPKQALFTKISKGGSFPKIVKKTGYPWFGLFIDFLIRHILTHKIIPEKNHLELILNQTNKIFLPSKTITAKDLYPELTYYQDIGAFIIYNFIEAKTITCEPEWSHSSVVGHPDIVIDSTVYDIKMTGSFGSMRSKTILQVLSYFCLAKLNNKEIDSIGLILPAQKKILKVDISGWKWKSFFDILEKTSTQFKKLPISFEAISRYQQIEPYIGSHIRRNGKVYKTIEPVAKMGIPFQTFITSPQKYGKVAQSDILKTRKIIDETKLMLFAHAPYIINLSRLYKDNFVIKALSEQVEAMVAMGGRGVIVHCGKQCEMKKEEALKNMTQALTEASKKATKECPILLETVAGEGTEMLSKIEDLIAYYLDLPQEVREKVGICLDTCHIFAAGYDPFEALLMLEGLPIKLIHFNDSLFPRGSRKDRHRPIGNGKIGLEKLLQVAEYALANNIPLVYE